MKLHTAGEDYLEAVLILQKKLGMVRSVDVARYLEVSKPSVCYAVGTLREGGFLTTDENHYICLLYTSILVGYSKASNFAAAFKRKYGVNPKNYKAEATIG